MQMDVWYDLLFRELVENDRARELLKEAERTASADVEDDEEDASARS